MNLLKMQIPAGCGDNRILVLASSVGLATIGVCVFSAVTSVAALFIFCKGGKTMSNGNGLGFFGVVGAIVVAVVILCFL